MAGLVDKFKRMWDAPDDEYDEYDEYTYEDESEEDLNASGSSSSSSSDYSYQRESTSAPRRNKVVNITRPQSSRSYSSSRNASAKKRGLSRTS